MTIAVVVIVRDRPERAERCLDLLLADHDRPPGDIIVVGETGRHPALGALLNRLVERGHVRVPDGAAMHGPVRAANAGLDAAARQDVVLLDGTAQVSPGWLRRLAGHARAHPAIGAVSPLTNAGGPLGLADRALRPPFGATAAETDAACRDANTGRAVDVPATGGACVYLRRDLLDQAGPLDADTFGDIEAATTDLRLRASALGWRHRLALDIFISYRNVASAFSEPGGDAAIPARFAAIAAMLRRIGGVLLHLSPPLAHRAPNRSLLLEEDGAETVISAPSLGGSVIARLPAGRPDDAVALLASCGVIGLRQGTFIRSPGPLANTLARRLGLPSPSAPPGYAALSME